MSQTKRELERIYAEVDARLQKLREDCDEYGLQIKLASHELRQQIEQHGQLTQTIDPRHYL